MLLKRRSAFMIETLVSVRGEVSRSEKPRKSEVVSKGEVS